MVKIRIAARGVIFNEQGEVLLMKIKADPTKSNQRDLIPFWMTPGGKIEGAETHEETLIREIWEETGITEFQIKNKLFYDEEFVTWDDVNLRSCHHYYLIHTTETKISTKKEVTLPKNLAFKILESI